MPRTILIVEDDEDTRAIYQAALAEHGYHVLIASHGAEGVHLARRHSPDLILLDIRMPIMDGWQAVDYIRSLPQTRSIPICAISAHEPEPEDLERAREMNIECFLTKPTDPRDLVQRIDDLVGPPSTATQPFGLRPTEP